jgi:hypothetical protein
MRPITGKIEFVEYHLGPNFQPEYTEEEMERIERMKDILKPAIDWRGLFLRPSGAFTKAVVHVHTT